MMKLPTRCVVAFASALALTAPSLPCMAQQPAPTKEQTKEAGTRFKKGLDLFKDGDYQAALIEFRRAYELAPNYNVLYNIGQVYFQLQDYPNALTALQRYIAEGGKSIPSSRHADVDRDIEKLLARVANFEIVTTVPDADITIDDIAVGKSPLAKPILVSAGKHKIAISKAGFTATTKIIEIASSETQKVPIDPVKIEVAPPPPPIAPPPETGTVTVPPTEPPPPPTPPPPTRSVPWAGIAITGGLTIGATVMGILALGASSSLATERANPTATRSSLDSAHDKTVAYALVTDILAGGAIIGFGVTLYVGLREPKKDSATPPTTAPAPAPATSFTTVRVGMGPGGVQLLGTF
jgi:hypothetical protein